MKRMNEMINTFSGALDKFTCKLLGMYEENGKVFSSQLSFYNYLLTGKLQKSESLILRCITFLVEWMYF